MGLASDGRDVCTRGELGELSVDVGGELVVFWFLGRLFVFLVWSVLDAFGCL